MSILDIFKGMIGSEVEEVFDGLDKTFDEFFGSHGQRKRFMKACRRLPNNDISIVQKVMNGTDDITDHSSLAGQIKKPSRAADVILMLEEELEETENTDLLLFLLALVQRDKIASKLDRSRFLPWEQPLLENKNLPAEFIQFLWDHHKKGRYKEAEWFESPRSLAKLTNCPLPVLKELLEINDAVLKKHIARHRNLDESLTDAFLNSTRLPEREQLAKSNYVSKEALLSLMRDEHGRVSEAARKQFKKRFPGKNITKKMIDEAINKWIEKPYVKPAKPKRKFNVYADSRMGVEHALSLKPSQRAAVAGHGDEDILAVLADDKSIAVRRAVAGRHTCPDDVLERYLTESDLTVVTNALLSITRNRPEVTFEELVSEDVIENSYILLNICLNEKGAIRPEYDKMDFTMEAEIERVKVVAQYTNNPMIQMRIINDLKEIPASAMLRWHLLRSLSYNHHLTKQATRKIALELGFGSESVLSRCTDKKLIRDFLSQRGIPTGVRGRLEAHLNSL